MTTLPLPPRPRILIIRRDNIGDLVCTTPAIAALRKRYPDAEIAALVNSYNADVLHNNPNLDHVFFYQKLKHVSGLIGCLNALYKRYRLIFQLRRWKPQVIILAKAGFDRHGLSLARQIGAKNIIGYIPDGPSHSRVLPNIQLRQPLFSSLHEVEAVCQLLSPLGIISFPGPLQVFPNQAEVTRLLSKFPKAHKRIGVHISARERERRWGFENFTVLIRRILESQPSCDILLFWSPGKADDPYHPGDDEGAKQLINSLCSDRLIPLPTQKLSDLIAAISLCDLFICADGGAMHLAAALDKKVIALFENQAAKTKHWYPWQVQHKMLHSDDPLDPSVRNISPQKLLDAMTDLNA